ncbi:MAG: hypothetical protein H6625_08045 [Bdellovibrionaceae bacterium]|nr:hypothetical protein [Pseudobdellovibrionaceae bacterium]
MSLKSSLLFITKTTIFLLSVPVYAVSPIGLQGRKILCSGILENGTLYPNLVEFVENKNGKPFAELERNMRASWDPSQFTDPNKHNPNEYLYLVHGILDRREFNIKMSRSFLLDEESKWSKIKSLVYNPDLISEIDGISASVISQDHFATFANSGYILEADYENVYATNGGDIGSGLGGTIEHLEKLNEAFGIMSPQDILQKKVIYHNEVKLAGTSINGIKIKVIGIFIKYLKPDEFSIPNERLKEFTQLAKERNLPIVYIHDETSLKPRPY